MEDGYLPHDRDLEKSKGSKIRSVIVWLVFEIREGTRLGKRIIEGRQTELTSGIMDEGYRVSR
jgi:hypothetical protein